MEASKAMKLTQLLLLVALLCGPGRAHASGTLVNLSTHGLKLVVGSLSLYVAAEATVELPPAFLGVSVDVYNLDTQKALPFVFTDATVVICIDHVSLSLSLSLAVDLCLGSLVGGLPLLSSPLDILSANPF